MADIIRIANIANYIQEIINGELVLTPRTKATTPKTKATTNVQIDSIPILLKNAPECKRKTLVLTIDEIFVDTLKRHLFNYEIRLLLSLPVNDYNNYIKELYAGNGIILC